MRDRDLSAAATTFAARLAALDDSVLTAAWPAPSPGGGFWSGYDERLREVAFRVYQTLRQVAVSTAADRPAPSEAQRILAQHQLAWRDLTGALAGVGSVRDAELDVEPAPGEWPLRTVLYHMALTERGFYSLIHWAVDRRRGGDKLPLERPEEYAESFGGPVSDVGSLAEIMGRFAALHARVQRDFSELDDDDLAAVNLWWEGYDVPARFRLHRFDAHLREHTIQVDKTLAAIGRAPRETERLARLIHRALGEVEGALLGAPHAASAARDSATAEIGALCESLTGLTA